MRLDAVDEDEAAQRLGTQVGVGSLDCRTTKCLARAVLPPRAENRRGMSRNGGNRMPERPDEEIGVGDRRRRLDGPPARRAEAVR